MEKLKIMATETPTLVPMPAGSRIAIIPARGGSKRLPRKNVKMFRGKPLIAWTIQVCKESNCFDKIIVSTDDAEIIEVLLLRHHVTTPQPHIA